MKLQAAGEDYLKALLVLESRNGEVRSVDLARYQKVSKASVCHAVAALKKAGCVTMDDDFFLHLTEEGREIAEKVYERHCFFTTQLIAAGVDRETAQQDACRMEHVISERSFQCLRAKLCLE